MNEAKKTESSGFLLIDKQPGITSFDVVARLRKLTKIKKIGHAGTLDPFASGLLIVAIGRSATKEISRYVKMDKSYEAEIVLGARNTTHDTEGVISEQKVSAPPSLKEVSVVLKSFLGEQEQIPPMFSAKKVNGKKLYELARQGKEIERAAVGINIYSLDVLSYEWPTLRVSVRVSSGTYIRSLASDIGEALGTGAYLRNLRRTSIGDFDISQAKNLEELGDWGKELFI